MDITLQVVMKQAAGTLLLFQPGIFMGQRGSVVLVMGQVKVILTELM